MSWLGPKLQPVFPIRAQRDLPLDGLRGLCALAVLFAHVFLPFPVMDPAWAPSRVSEWFDLGAAAVLMFFVLSGYVIGLVTPGPFTPAAAREYALHRVARLVPLNTLAVLLSWALLPRVMPHVTGRLLAGNLFFLQNAEPYPGIGSFPLLPNNPNLWSLNYEAVYYIGFIFLWRFAPRLRVVFAAMAGLVIARSIGLPVSELVGRYACGSLYWLAGLAIAWLTPPADSIEHRSEWPAALLGFYVMWRVGAVRSLCYEWNLSTWLWVTPASPHRLDQLGACVWVLLAVTNRAPALRKFLSRACLVLPTASLIAAAGAGEWSGSHSVSAIALLTAWTLVGRRFSLTALGRVASIGGISYAIYVIGGPIQIGQRQMVTEFSGTWLTFAVRAVLVVGLTLATSWLLERRLAPVIGAWIRRRGGSRPSRPQPAAPVFPSP